MTAFIPFPEPTPFPAPRRPAPVQTPNYFWLLSCPSLYTCPDCPSPLRGHRGLLKSICRSSPSPAHAPSMAPVASLLQHKRFWACSNSSPPSPLAWTRNPHPFPPVLLLQPPWSPCICLQPLTFVVWPFATMLFWASELVTPSA